MSGGLGVRVKMKGFEDVARWCGGLDDDLSWFHSLFFFLFSSLGSCYI